MPLESYSGHWVNKHRSSSLLHRRILASYYDAILKLLPPSPIGSLLDVGVGEGDMLQIIIRRRRVEDLFYADLSLALLLETRSRIGRGTAVAASAEALPFRNKAFSAGVCLQVLEHLSDPGAAIRELFRVTSGPVVLSVPHEPWWRLCNVARLRYLPRLGNTPGHLNHWGKESFAALIRGNGGSIQELLQPFPFLVARCGSDQ